MYQLIEKTFGKIEHLFIVKSKISVTKQKLRELPQVV